MFVFYCFDFLGTCGEAIRSKDAEEFGGDEEFEGDSDAGHIAECMAKADRIEKVAGKEGGHKDAAETGGTRGQVVARSLGKSRRTAKVRTTEQK